MPELINEQPIEEAEKQVEDAVESVTEAVKDAPNEAMHDLLTSVKDVLQGVQAELKRANDLAEKAVTPEPEPEPAPVPEPDIEVPVPKPTERKIRRGGRKVTRRG